MGLTHLAVSLEALGMILDPMKRELRPLPMLLAPAWPRRARR